MKLVFVSGPYRGDVEGNISRAKRAAVRLWQRGYAVICPHLNTANFDGLCDDEVWLTGDLEILARCDTVYMLTNWKASEGARAEHRLAADLGKEIVYEANE